ncbi:phenylacetic acid degradation bifunctional protein PaaZ [Candidatus Viadribacter manganicus]|uniref:Enoyl-CoA hydratase n=1 Tax=Candidatus Viadribacter manganicus TaxID=1759059 RepID=A0A1B1AGD0_9PROT|nr:phenylacetic acid degradation bifunctional protein PaaZ [Candidatus Viadribacter manganicus]ANP45619.1 enoyl-CoA hydratase [Candidatus Viadribacter manganicus]
MKPITLQNYAEGHWVAGSGGLAELRSAIDGDVVALTSSQGLDFAAMLKHARSVGASKLQAMTFHDRAKMLKALADALTAHKEELYELSYNTGATKADAWIDIDGGIGTFAVYQGKGRRELPNDRILIDGNVEALSRNGTFQGLHVYTSLQGVAVHINAFNFPVWGMLEKLAVTFLAGVPAIVKPASATAYLTEAAVRIMLGANVLPPGTLQLIVGGVGDLFDHLTSQDVVSFTGSAQTAAKLKSHPVVQRESVRFVAEQDSLNASVLGPDATPDSPEFDLFIKEVTKEMTVKAGQKCTAIRRAFAPASVIDVAQEAITARLAKITIGDPRDEATRMGALVSTSQREDVRAKIAEIARDGAIVYGDPNASPVNEKGAFISPVLIRCDAPFEAGAVHEVEAFGPVATLMPYAQRNEVFDLVNRGKGSLVMSVFSYDTTFAQDVVLDSGSFHGRIAFIDRDSAKESTGHGAPMPHMIHGGPGRAGGGEEMGGIRGVTHYMQRTALQGHPRTLAAIVNRYIAGMPTENAEQHPFRRKFHDLPIGYQLKTKAREITLEDIEHFAHFTGDTFYAHMDEQAAKANPLFGGRVAHGYLILAFAAGLFVDPDPGPVLANYGLDNLRFVKPVKPGDTVEVALTVKDKTLRRPDQGEVRWDVVVTNRDGDTVAAYDLLTMNAA